jgi:hypothetical protein
MMRRRAALLLAFTASLFAPGCHGIPDDRTSSLEMAAPEAPIAVGVAMDIPVSYGALNGPLCGAKAQTAGGVRPQGGTLPDPCMYQSEPVEILDHTCDDACAFEDSPTGVRLRPLREGSFTLHVRAKRTSDGSVHETSASVRAETFARFELATNPCGTGQTSICGGDLLSTTLAVGVHFHAHVTAVSTTGTELANDPDLTVGAGLKRVDDSDPTTVDAMVIASKDTDIVARLGTFDQTLHVDAVDLDPHAPLEVHATKDGVVDPAVATTVDLDLGANSLARYALTTAPGPDGKRALVNAAQIDAFQKWSSGDAYVQYGLTIGPEDPFLVFQCIYDSYAFALSARGKDVVTVTCKGMKSS